MNVRDWFGAVWNQNLVPTATEWWNAYGSTPVRALTGAVREAVEVGQDLLRTAEEHPVASSLIVLGSGLVLTVGGVPPVEWIVGTIVVWCAVGWLEDQVSQWLAIQVLRALTVPSQQLGRPQPNAVPAYSLV